MASEFKQIFDIQFDLVTFDNNESAQGTFVYPFQMNLPSWLPSSTDGTFKIAYSIGI
jgi:hypothetical protein